MMTRGTFPTFHVTLRVNMINTTSSDTKKLQLKLFTVLLTICVKTLHSMNNLHFIAYSKSLLFVIVIYLWTACMHGHDQVRMSLTLAFTVLLPFSFTSATGKGCSSILCLKSSDHFSKLKHIQLYWSHHLIRYVLETQSPTHVSLILDSWCGM